MIKEQCLTQNPLRNALEKEDAAGITYKEAVQFLIKEDFEDVHEYLYCVKKQYHLISLVDKVKNFIITILYDAFINKRMLPELLY